MGRGEPARTVRDQGVENFPALTVRKRSQPDAVRLQRVKRQVADGDHGGETEGGIGRCHVHPRLQRLEVGAPVGEGDDLAVEQRLPAGRGGHRRAEPGQVGVRGADVLAGPRDQPDPAAGDERERAHAVPLHLHRPLGQPSGRRRARQGEHGRKRRGQRGPSGAAHPPRRYPQLPPSYRSATSDAASRRSGS